MVNVPWWELIGKQSKEWVGAERTMTKKVKRAKVRERKCSERKG